MLIGDFNTDEHVLVVAEIGNNHEGDFDVARRLVDEAAAAAVDAVKFQTFRTELFVCPADEQRFARMRGFELSGEQFAALADHARAAGLLFVSTPLDLDSARLLEPLVDAFKIASGDIDFYPLLEQVARSTKPVVISSGLSTLERAKLAVATVAQIRSQHRATHDLAALHCVSAYPAPPEQVNLAAIGTLRRELGCTVGYSDHTLGIEAAVLSVAAGARIVEKHFTLDKQYSEFRDHQLSADPPEMAELVRRVRAADALTGRPHKTPQPCETDALVSLRRSIAARCDLSAGHTLTPSDLMWVRPATGLAAGREALVLGRRAKRDIACGETLTEALVE